MTQFDLTPEQSLRNFKARSMLNAMDVVQVLDSWHDQLLDGKLRIPMSPAGKQALERIVSNMRTYVLTAGLPDIVPAWTGTKYRYSLDWYRDGLQLGIEAYGPDTRFLEDGSEAPPMVDESADMAVETALPVPEDFYRLVHKSVANTVHITEWADANEAKPGTARQWASRGQIETVKEGDSLRVSEIEYTPDAYRNATGLSYRFKYVGQLPESAIDGLAGLDGMILDLMLVPTDDGYRLLTIRTPEGQQTAKAESVPVTDKQKDSLLSAIAAMDDVQAPSAKKYEEPFFQTARTGMRHHVQITAPSPRDLELIKPLQRRVLTNEKPTPGTDKLPEYATGVALEFRDQNRKSLQVTGIYHIYDVSAEDRLFMSVFGWTPLRKEIADELRGAGLSEGTAKSVYKWNRNVFLVRMMGTTLDPETTVAALRCLPRLCREACGLEPTLFLVQTDTMDKALRDLLPTVGFVPGKHGLLAYAGTGKVFKGFKPVG